jgi:26S proteasome regulatory subunit N1
MKKLLSDVMSVLAMTMSLEGSRACLKFKMSGNVMNISSWGHEYVRCLAGEISEEYNQRIIEANVEEDPLIDDLMDLIDDIVPFQLKHNAEAEAVDLLLEVRKLNKLIELPVIDDRNFERVCLYLIRISSFIPDPEDLVVLFNVVFFIYKKQQKFTEALRIAMKINNLELMQDLFKTPKKDGEIVNKQMALILAHDRSNFVAEDEALNELIGNVDLSDRFLSVARELDLLAPKSPEDIYKTHLLNGSGASRSRLNSLAGSVGLIDSAKANLASSFVNSFVNAGFCKDKLILEDEEKGGGNSWLFKNKGHGMTSAAASLGMVMMWNVEEGLNQIDKYFHNSDDFVKAGACLGVGIISIGIRNESDPALAILSDYLDSNTCGADVRIAAICGLGLAYAGAEKTEMREHLESIVASDVTSITEASMAALTLGLSFVGTCDDEISSVILQRLMESSAEDLNHTVSRFLCLGLGLLYLGKNERAEAVLEAVRTIEHKRAKYCEITLESCAFAGTGNVLKVQQMLRQCTDHLLEAAEHQSAAVLGIALVTLGEDMGVEMTLRTFEHLLHYGELPIRKVVPLAIGLLYISNPEYSVVDQLSRLSHDQDAELSQCAIFALGLVSAGSNNSRVAGLLRQLSEFYAKEANHLFVVRIAQGLNAMGKGLIGLSPFHSDRFLFVFSLTVI